MSSATSAAQTRLVRSRRGPGREPAIHQRHKSLVGNKCIPLPPPPRSKRMHLCQAVDLNDHPLTFQRFHNTRLKHHLIPIHLAVHQNAELFTIVCAEFFGCIGSDLPDPKGFLVLHQTLEQLLLAADEVLLQQQPGQLATVPHLSRVLANLNCQINEAGDHGHRADRLAEIADIAECHHVNSPRCLGFSSPRRLARHAR